MTQTRVYGDGLWMPRRIGNDFLTAAGAGYVTNIIQTDGQKFAWIGQVWTVDRSSKSITRLGFRTGAFLSTTSTSQWLISLQNVSTSATPVRPDEVVDEFALISSTDAGLAVSTWYRTQPLSANRAVVFGDLLAVVIEFSSTGNLGGDRISVANNFFSFTSQNCAFSGTTSRSTTAGDWGFNTSTFTNLVLEFSDGTFGTLDKAWPNGAWNQETYNASTSSGSGGDERALRFSVPFNCSVDACYFATNTPVASSANFDVVLYQGTTALQTVSVNCIQAMQALGQYQISFPEQAITAGTEYFMAVKPTTNSSISITTFDVSTNAYLQANYGSTSFYYAARTDGGSWETTNTRQPMIGVRISKLDTGPTTEYVAPESQLSQVKYGSRGVAY